MSQARINICCPGMRDMVDNQTLAISNMSHSGWIKVLQHNGTEEIGENPIRFNYNNIQYCPFCGNNLGLSNNNI